MLNVSPGWLGWGFPVAGALNEQPSAECDPSVSISTFSARRSKIGSLSNHDDDRVDDDRK